MKQKIIAIPSVYHSLPMTNIGPASTGIEHYVGTIETPIGTGTAVILDNGSILINCHLIVDINAYKTDSENHPNAPINLNDYLCDLTSIEAYFINDNKLFIVSFQTLICSGLTLLQEETHDVPQNWDFAILQPSENIKKELGDRGIQFSTFDHTAIFNMTQPNTHIFPPTLNFTDMTYHYNTETFDSNSINPTIGNYTAILPDHSSQRHAGSSGSITLQDNLMFLFNFQRGRLLPAAHLKHDIQRTSTQEINPMKRIDFSLIDTSQLTGKHQTWESFLSKAKKIPKTASILAIYAAYKRQNTITKNTDLQKEVPAIYLDNGRKILDEFYTNFNTYSTVSSPFIQKMNTLIDDIEKSKKELLCNKLFLGITQMAHECDTNKVLSTSLESIKIGTEFTFCSQNTKNKVLFYTSVWATTALETCKQTIETTLKKKVTISPCDTKTKSAAAFKVTYTHDPNGFWWILDADDGCLETQTKPLDLNQLKSHPIQKIIKHHIFELIQKCGFKPDTSKFGGGGHLSLDSQMVGNNSEVLLKTLHFIQTHHKEIWDPHFEYDKEDGPLNAAWLDELTIQSQSSLTQFTALVKKTTDLLLTTSPNWPFHLNALKQFIGTLKNKNLDTLTDTKDQERLPTLTKMKENIKRNPDHYQAINIEHLNKDEDQLKHRIEFRRIPAQTDYDQLIKDVDNVFKVITKARESIKQDQNIRLNTLIGNTTTNECSN